MAERPAGPLLEGGHPPQGLRNTLATLAYRALTLVLAALAVLGQLAYLDALYWGALGLGSLGQGGMHPALLSSVITSTTVTTVAAAAAVTLTFAGPRARGAHPLALALAAWGYLLAYSGLTILLAPDPGSPLRDAFVIHFLVVEALAMGGLFRFTAVFPQTLPAGALQDPDTLPVGLRSLQYLRRWLLAPAGPWLAVLAGAALVVGVNAAMGRPTQDAALLLLTDILRLAGLAIVVLNLRKGFLEADVPGRRAMFWFVVGFTLLMGAVGTLLGGNILTAVTGWEIPGFNWQPVVLDLGVIGLIWGAAMAVLYRGPLKPGRVSRRMAVVASYVTVGLFLAAGMESLLAGTVASRITLAPGVGTLVSFLTMALLYLSTYRLLESMVYSAWAHGGRGA